jgi:molybdopterin molybdotransferase
MPEFLNLLPPGEALKVWLSHLPLHRPVPELVDLVSAAGRVTASAIVSPEPMPAFPRSTVDGFAVKAKDTYGASHTLPAYLKIEGEIVMGQRPAFTLGEGSAAIIYTGGMVPEGADAVVMLEQTQLARPDEIEVLRPVAPGENVLQTGEDVAAGQEVIPEGVRLRPAEIGGLAAIGIIQVSVARRPKVGIISSGDEVIPPQEMPAQGQVRDVNTYALSAVIERAGGLPVPFGIVPDRYEALEMMLSQALQECDCVVITAGSSASTRDLTAQAVQSQGEPGVLVHGVNVRPGKPTILAVCRGKPVIGLPGNPVSALVIAKLFLIPVIDYLTGARPDLWKPFIPARLTVNLPSQAGRDDWVPVRLIASGEEMLVEPIFFKSNLIFNLVQADGLIHIPSDVTGLETGETVQVTLL